MKKKQYKNKQKQNSGKFCSISENSVLISVVVTEDENDEVDQLMTKNKSFHSAEFF